jgi:predicted nicotinamide N-methyase
MPSPIRDHDLVEQELTVGGRRFLIRRPRSAEDLIDEAEYARDERLPYWAELWASGRALAEALAGEPLHGLRVLELGCGLGLPSLVAAAAGARTLATDWYPEALRALRHNARVAGVRIETMLVDWREPPPPLLCRAPFDLVIAADVLYETRNARALAALLPRLTAPGGGRALVADPRRPDATVLIEALAAAGWRHEQRDVRVEPPIDEAGPVVRLHHLRPPESTAERDVR